MTNFEALYNFIDRAVKSRKYPDATAYTLRAALKLYEPVLNEDELASLDKFKSNFEQITASVFNKNASRFSANSLTTYKSRVQKVLMDFDKYSDPAKMSNWNPKVVIRAKKAALENKIKNAEEISTSEVQEKIPNNMHKIELALRTDAKFVIVVPRDISQTEADTVNAIISSLVKK